MVITYIPDGPVTAALKRHVKRQTPRPALGNLGPLLDENLNAARKHGHFLYHPDDLRLLPGVQANPAVVDDGFAVLRGVMTDKGIPEPDTWTRDVPYYLNISKIVVRTIVLALAMTIAITAAVLLGQDDAIAAMVVAIVAISLLGAGALALIFKRSVTHVDLPAGHS